MITAGELLDLIETGVIETYRGRVEVLTGQGSQLVVIGQGERFLVLSLEQAVDLVDTLLYKLGGK